VEGKVDDLHQPAREKATESLTIHFATETNQKLAFFHKELNVLQWAAPVHSVRNALLQIKEMGHPLHIVTARSEAEKVR
jgi:hypothetical protein